MSGILNVLLISIFLVFCACCAVAIHEYYSKLTGLLFITFFFFFFFTICIYNLYHQEKSATKLTFYKRLLNMQKDYYVILIKQDTETKKFRHDIKNHLYCVQILLEQNAIREAKNYIHSLYNLVYNENTRQTSGNHFLDIVIQNVFSNYKDITLKWRGHFPEHTSIPDIDLCILFSNLLQNAAEAALASTHTDKIVSADVAFFENTLFITVANPCSKAPVIKNGHLQSSKNDYGKHGYGMLNIQDVVKNHNGTIQHYYQDQVFTVELYFDNVLIDTISPK